MADQQCYLTWHKKKYFSIKKESFAFKRSASDDWPVDLIFASSDSFNFFELDFQPTGVNVRLLFYYRNLRQFK